MKGSSMAVRTGYEHGQFCWIDLVARDMAEARKFYLDLFGWESVDVDTQGGPPYAHFYLQGKNVAGVGQMNEQMLSKELPANWNSYINVNDIEAVCNKTVELGGRVTVPVMQILEAGRLAFIEDPTGAQVGLWEKGDHFGAELMQDYHSCSWNELLTRDLEAARDFYGRLFDWEFADFPSAMSKYYVISQQGEENSGMMQMDERWGEMASRWLIYFAVQSVDLTVDQVRQLGGFVQVHPFDIPEGRFAMVSDEQGALFDLVEMYEDVEEAP
jgi:hypothetical protein